MTKPLLPLLLVALLAGAARSQLHAIHDFHGQADLDAFGFAVADAGDVDGDGRADLIVGDSSQNRISVYSGLDGTQIASAVGNSGEQFGYAVAGLRDLSGDGRMDLLVGAWLGRQPGSNTVVGSARLLTSEAIPQGSYGSTLANPALVAAWQGDGGSPFARTGTIMVDGATPGGFGLYGVSLAAIDYLAFGYLPLLIAIDPINLLDQGPFGYGFMGELVVPGASRQNPFLAGTRVHLQFYETSPVIRASNGLWLDMVP